MREHWRFYWKLWGAVLAILAGLYCLVRFTA